MAATSLSRLPLAALPRGVSGAGCRSVHSSRQPDGVHSASPCLPNPTASARQSGAQANEATPPVCCGVWPQSPSSRLRASCSAGTPASWPHPSPWPGRPVEDCRRICATAAAAAAADKLLLLLLATAAAVGSGDAAGGAGCRRSRCTAPLAVPSAMSCACAPTCTRVALRQHSIRSRHSNTADGLHKIQATVSDSWQQLCSSCTSCNCSWLGVQIAGLRSTATVAAAAHAASVRPLLASPRPPAALRTARTLLPAPPASA